MEPVIKIQHVHKVFRDTSPPHLKALDDITLDIHAGEIFMFLGPSGCGKSTLLRIMSGLEKDFTGSVMLGAGVKHSDMSFIFQQFGLLPWLTVAENVATGLVGHGVPRGEQPSTATVRIFSRVSMSSETVMEGGLTVPLNIAIILPTVRLAS